jgi:UDP-N-acetyl-2-amino-2-deoxyglucuronate dehydrogenase
MKNFAITGVAGYIAPRHLQAIKDTGNRIVAAIDPHDSVGILDKYFSEASFFTEIERFDRHLEKLRRSKDNEKIDYLTICTPNHLHDSHIRLALRVDADAICEKPLVLNPWNLDALQKLEIEYGKRIYTILQLRFHPVMIELKNKLSGKNIKHNVCLTNITSRGLWYKYSWKGIPEKSGGLVTNIGIHLFDILIWLFGKVKATSVHLSEPTKMSGFLELEKANVTWFLSLDKNDLPKETRDQNKYSYRSILIDGEDLHFAEGFADLHTIVYKNILSGNGLGIEEARPSIEAVYNIRNSKIIAGDEPKHPNLINKKENPDRILP